MKIFREFSQGQKFLLPPSMDEFVPENHEARIINDVGDNMGSPLLAKYEGGGAPAYHPVSSVSRLRDYH
jgi:transposase